MTASDSPQFWPPGHDLTHLVGTLSHATGPVLEQGLSPIPDLGHAGLPGLVLAVSTQTALRLDLAHGFCQVLAARSGVALSLRQDMEVALQEIIGNAVLHGNLGMGSDTRNQPGGAHAFAQLMAQRLDDPSRTSRPILLEGSWDAAHLELSVTDWGTGFDPQSIVPKSIDSASGRGLEIASGLACQMRHSLGGRRTTLIFNR